MILPHFTRKVGNAGPSTLLVTTLRLLIPTRRLVWRPKHKW